MKTLSLYAADGVALTSVKIEERKRTILLPAPDFPAPVYVRGLVPYEDGATIEILPGADEITLRLVNRRTHETRSLGEWNTLDSIDRLLTLHDGKFLRLTVQDTDEELYTKAKALADSQAEHRDKWTAAAIIAGIILTIYILWRINIIGLAVLCLCLIAL